MHGPGRRARAAHDLDERTRHPMVLTAGVATPRRLIEPAQSDFGRTASARPGARLPLNAFPGRSTTTLATWSLSFCFLAASLWQGNECVNTLPSLCFPIHPLDCSVTSAQPISGQRFANTSISARYQHALPGMVPGSGKGLSSSRAQESPTDPDTGPWTRREYRGTRHLP